MMQLPLFKPNSNWTPPEPSTWRDPARLSPGDLIGFDTETCDPFLKDKGPGGFSGEGRLIGVSLSMGDWCCYLPIGHEEGGNLDPQQVLRYVGDVLKTQNGKVGANIGYDLEYLLVNGIKVEGRLIDVLVAEPLLDEWKDSYSLDATSLTHLKRQKNETGLQAAAKAFGINAKGDMWRLHSRYVGPYAETDAVLPVEVWQKQEPLLLEQDLMSVFDTEMELVPLLLENRRRGVRIDMDRVAQLKTEWTQKQKEIQAELDKKAGVYVDVWSNGSLARACGIHNISYPTTDRGNPSFTQAWLDRHESPMLNMVNEVRKYSKAVGTFLDNMLIDKTDKDGRLRPVYQQVKSDDGGTRDGRFSCTKPNLQQVPSRDPAIGIPMRKCFLPEEGELWAALDYGSQEPRILAHFAGKADCRQADALVQAYNEDPNMSTHDYVANMAGIERKKAKVLNLAISYGGGVGTISAQLGISKDEAKQLLETYYRGAPYVKDLQDLTRATAIRRGYLVLLGGRRIRFPLYQPVGDNMSRPLPIAEAQFKWKGQRLEPAFLHKTLNRLVQGSAAYQTKKAMVDCAKAGHLFLLTVHDELGFSVQSPEVARNLAHIMETGVELLVPNVVDVEIGESWGHSMEAK